MAVTNSIDRTVQLIQDRLNLNTINHELIAGNLANMDTPGYKARKLTFEENLRDAMEDGGLQLSKTSGGHIDPTDLTDAMESPEVIASGPVELDTQMTRMAQNSIEYMYMVSLLNKKLLLLRAVIDEGGK
jgi:flagellar basal-body rod protein FlgB